MRKRKVVEERSVGFVCTTEPVGWLWSERGVVSLHKHMDADVTSTYGTFKAQTKKVAALKWTAQSVDVKPL